MDFSQKVLDLSRGNDIFRSKLSHEDLILFDTIKQSPLLNEILEGAKNFNNFDNNIQPDHSTDIFSFRDEKYQFKIIYLKPNDWTQLVNPSDTSVFKRKIVIGLVIEFERSERTIEIAKGNDLFRSSFSGEKICISDDVDNSPHRNKIIEAVRNYSNFYGVGFLKGQSGLDISCYGEHAMGQFMVANETYSFEFSYFSKDFELAGEDPYECDYYERVLFINKKSEK